MIRQSESIKELAQAMVKACGEMEDIEKNSKNVHIGNRYADLLATRKANRPILASHGLSIIQGVGSIRVTPEEMTVSVSREGTTRDHLATVTLTTRVLHESGEWIECDSEMPFVVSKGLNASQALGVAISYARRYSEQSIFALAAEDTDGGAGPAGLDDLPPKGAGSKPSGDGLDDLGF